MTIETHESAKSPRPETKDRGLIRMGSLSPSFPAVRGTPASVADIHKTRIGSMSPDFPPVRGTPASVADTRKIRMGSMSPDFPPVRDR